MGGGIVDVVDEILASNPNATGLTVNRYSFGSNGQDKADYSHGVLERFTGRSKNDWSLTGIKKGMSSIKTIANPRAVDYINNPHYALYFGRRYAVNELGDPVKKYLSAFEASNKIILNHYFTKSREEFEKKINRGLADGYKKRTMEEFGIRDFNDVYDDGILKYRAAREKSFSPVDEAQRFARVKEALTKILFDDETDLETLLTCRAVSDYLREKFPEDVDSLKACEEAAIVALSRLLDNIHKSSLLEIHMFIREMPNLLNLSYPVVKDLRVACLASLPKILTMMSAKKAWQALFSTNYIYDLLKSGG